MLSFEILFNLNQDVQALQFVHVTCMQCTSRLSTDVCQFNGITDLLSSRHD